MISFLAKKDEVRFRKEVELNRKLIRNLGGKLRYYIKDVIARAKLNKASRLYEKGISLEKTAKALGISLWELSEYMGSRSKSEDNIYTTMTISDRIKIAKEVFR